MNPTDEVDDLLKRAGARWRADQGSGPEVDPTVLVKRRRWVPAVAAATVAVVGAAVLTVLPEHHTNRPMGQVGQVTEVGQGGPVGAVGSPKLVRVVAEGKGNDSLLVMPGDRVRVTGQVIAVPGKAPVFCAPQVESLVGYSIDSAPSCPDGFGVALSGVDLARLADLATVDGVRSGTVTLTGVWGEHGLTVQQQSAPTANPPVEPSEPACPAPAGGWTTQANNLNEPAVTGFLDAHAGKINGPVLRYPRGTEANAPVVVMIGVAHGDPQAIRTEFEKVFRGNLCVAPVLLSRTDEQRVTDAVGRLMSRKDLGIRSTSGLYGGRAVVRVLAYTPELRKALTPIGLDLIQIDPEVRPA